MPINKQLYQSTFKNPFLHHLFYLEAMKTALKFLEISNNPEK
jgi:hypothetical protein